MSDSGFSGYGCHTVGTGCAARLRFLVSLLPRFPKHRTLDDLRALKEIGRVYLHAVRPQGGGFYVTSKFAQRRFGIINRCTARRMLHKRILRKLPKFYRYRLSRSDLLATCIDRLRMWMCRSIYTIADLFQFGIRRRQQPVSYRKLCRESVYGVNEPRRFPTGR